MCNQDTITLRINGQTYQTEGSPTRPLIDFIREDLQLTGTKIGCGSGECGACTIIMDGKPVNSCLIPLASAANKEILTIEGLRVREDFKTLSEAMVKNGAVQCGFCTPGIMTTLWAWIQQPDLYDGDVTYALKNNLCRCTGYQGILQAAKKVVHGEE